MNRKSKQHSIMVRVVVVAFVLLSGLVVVEAVEAAAAGAEDQDDPRFSSVLTTGVEEVRSVPVPKRKLSSKSSNVSQDDVVSKEVERILRLLVFKTAVDMSRFFYATSTILGAG